MEEGGERKKEGRKVGRKEWMEGGRKEGGGKEGREGKRYEEREDG